MTVHTNMIELRNEMQKLNKSYGSNAVVQQDKKEGMITILFNSSRVDNSYITKIYELLHVCDIITIQYADNQIYFEID